MTLSRDELQAKYSEAVTAAGQRGIKVDAAQVKEAFETCKETLALPKPAEKVIAEAGTKLDSALTWIKEQALVKTEDGNDYPASAYAYVPDKEKPSTWKLRLWEDTSKKMTKTQLGRAAAALSPGGFRGEKAQIPEADVAAVKSKIRAGYRSLDVPDADISKWVKEVNPVNDYIFESVSVDVKEATRESLAKGIIPVRILQPGFNVGKGRFYTDQAVKDAARVFENTKMYANHPTDAEERARPERDIRDVAAVLKNTRLSPLGNAVGDAVGSLPWLKEMAVSLFDAGCLDQLAVSINAVGKGYRGKIEDVDTFIVEGLTKGRSVDFVTEPGAGGRAGLMESVEKSTIDTLTVDLDTLKEVRSDLVDAILAEYQGKNNVEVKKKMELQETVDTQKATIDTLTKEKAELEKKIAEAATAKAKADAQALIKEAVAKAALPEAAKARILDQFKEAVTAEGVDAAVKAESDYIATITESGKVRNLGSSVPDPDKGRKALKESFKQEYLSQGRTEAEAEKMAEIAANGR